METGCLWQQPANIVFLCYLLVTVIVTGVLRYSSHDRCGTIFRSFHLIRSTAVPKARQMVAGRRLPRRRQPYGYLETRHQVCILNVNKMMLPHQLPIDLKRMVFGQRKLIMCSQAI